MSEATFFQNFPTPVLTPTATLTCPPTFQSLQLVQKELNANATSVYSNRGGGLHGHLTLTIPAPAYLALAGVAFLVPAVPGPTPDMPAGATQFQIAEAIRQHTENNKAFQRYHDVDKALRKLLIAATPAIYIELLSDPDYGFGTSMGYLWPTIHSRQRCQPTPHECPMASTDPHRNVVQTTRRWGTSIGRSRRATRRCPSRQTRIQYHPENRFIC